VEAQEVPDNDVGAAVGSTDRGVGVDVAAPSKDATVLVLDRFDALGDIRFDHVRKNAERFSPAGAKACSATCER
jgi:hypothetical protein